jgi:two-component system NtrC family sensor kinase
MSPDDLQSLFRAKGVWRGAITRTRKDGTTFPVAAAMTSLLDEHGRVAHVVSVERDVSEERKLREQLIHSERLSAVGQLVAGVAHELNNPLQSVIGIVDVLLQSERRQDIRHDLDQVRGAGYRAARIVKSLLSFARRSATERGIGNLNEMVQSTLELRRYELQHANISVHEELANPAPLAFVNSDEIRQVVLNLILNAEQAMRGAGRGGTLNLRTGATDETAFFEIADDGPGIPDAAKGRVFEPFFTTKDVGQGTGLGLSISLGIAEAHGGSLTLTPRERGACFTLTLPSLPSSVRSEAADSAAHSAARTV